MTFNISEFSANINRLGTTKNSLFVVTISPSAGLQGRLGLGDGDLALADIKFLCKAAVIPGMQISTVGVTPGNIGMIERRAVAMEQFDLLPLQFMVDSNFRVYRFFNKWMQSIVNYDDSSVGASINGGQTPYMAAYKDNIVSTVTIEVFSELESTYTINLSNAFPINVGEVGLAWENTAEVMTLPIGFTYDRMTRDGTISGKVQDVAGNGFNNIATGLPDLGQIFGATAVGSAVAGLQNTINELSGVLSIF